MSSIVNNSCTRRAIHHTPLSGSGELSKINIQFFFRWVRDSYLVIICVNAIRFEFPRRFAHSSDDVVNSDFFLAWILISTVSTRRRPIVIKFVTFSQLIYSTATSINTEPGGALWLMNILWMTRFFVENDSAVVGLTRATPMSNCEWLTIIEERERERGSETSWRRTTTA